MIAISTVLIIMITIIVNLFVLKNSSWTYSSYVMLILRNIN